MFAAITEHQPTRRGKATVYPVGRTNVGGAIRASLPKTQAPYDQVRRGRMRRSPRPALCARRLLVLNGFRTLCVTLPARRVALHVSMRNASTPLCAPSGPVATEMNKN